MPDTASIEENRVDDDRRGVVSLSGLQALRPVVDLYLGPIAAGAWIVNDCIEADDGSEPNLYLQISCCVRS